MPSTVPAAPESPGPQEDPLIGLQVGEYRILELVGEGGMGVVYRGVQPIIKKRVAIKILKPAFASDESQVKRLVAEAEAVNAIGHRNIIDIFSLGTLPDGRPYIIMEYLDGEPLDVWLNRHGRPPLPVALELLIEMCGPLAAAHRAGVIHRDLKPSNVFLCNQPDGSKFLKLLDFGLAKRALGLDGSTAQTSQAVVSGTPDYMAPEQARALPISPRSDIYALGVVAFELITGRVPFIGATPMDVMVSHVSKPAPRLRTFEPTVPEALDKLVARMLAKEPEARPQTVEEVRACLEEVLMAGGEAPPRPSQTSLPRLTGLEAPRPSSPQQSAGAAPLPLVAGPPLEPAQPPPAGVVPGTPPDAGLPRPVPSPVPLLTPLAESPAPAPPPSAPPRNRQAPGASPSLRTHAVTPSSPSKPGPTPWRWAGLAGGVLSLAALALWWSGALNRPDGTPPPRPATAGAPKQPASAVDDTAPTGDTAPAADSTPTGDTTPTTGPATPDSPRPVEKSRPTPARKKTPSSEALLRRIARLETVAKKKNLGPSATKLLEAYRLEATAAESASAREALARKLDGWEDVFLGR